jgi:hypothetical protein
MKRVLPMQKHLHPQKVKRTPTLTVLVTVSGREPMATEDATAAEANEQISLHHPQMKRVASTEDTPGEIVTITPGE